MGIPQTDSFVPINPLGAGGYRFSDYARLGAPLSLLVIIIGTPLILWVWPL
jgi:di/tricarboxylate transporter